MNQFKAGVARKSAFVACGVAIAAVATGTAIASVVTGTPGGAPKGLPDVKRLFNPALAYVRRADHGQLAKAVIYEADAVIPTPSATTAGIISWRFIFQNPTPGSPYASARVQYGPSPKTFYALVPSRTPYLEDVVIAKPPKLSLAQGLTKLRAAGFKQDLESVTLRDPLGPKKVNPLYIFGFDGGVYAAVDTVTGKVSKYS